MNLPIRHLTKYLIGCIAKKCKMLKCEVRENRANRLKNLKANSLLKGYYLKRSNK